MTETPYSLLWQFVKRILILYIVWLLIQTTFIPAKNQDIYTITFPLKMLFSSTFSGSWFYAALIVSTSIVFFFRKRMGGAHIRRYNKLFHILFGPYRNRCIGCFL